MDALRKDSTTVIEEIRRARLTYCGPPKLENLSHAIERIVREGIRGDFIEAGVALGGSAILMGSLKPSNTELHLYDVFGMIPPPGDQDGEDAHRRDDVIKSGASPGLGSDRYYGYVDSLQDKVLLNMGRWGLSCQKDLIELHPGLFEETLSRPNPLLLRTSIATGTNRLTCASPESFLILHREGSWYLTTTIHIRAAKKPSINCSALVRSCKSSLMLGRLESDFREGTVSQIAGSCYEKCEGR